jgi:hypothetical protein
MLMLVVVASTDRTAFRLFLCFFSFVVSMSGFGYTVSATLNISIRTELKRLTYKDFHVYNMQTILISMITITRSMLHKR